MSAAPSPMHEAIAGALMFSDLPQLDTLRASDIRKLADHIAKWIDAYPLASAIEVCEFCQEALSGHSATDLASCRADLSAIEERKRTEPTLEQRVTRFFGGPGWDEIKPAEASVDPDDPRLGLPTKNGWGV